MTYKQFLNKLEKLILLHIVSTKDKEHKKSFRDMLKLIVMFKNMKKGNDKKKTN